MSKKSARRRPPRRPPPDSSDVDANASSKVLDDVDDACDEPSAPPRAPDRPRPGFPRPRPPLAPPPAPPRVPSGVNAVVSPTETMLCPPRRPSSSRTDAPLAFADAPPTPPDDGTNGTALAVNPDDSGAGDASPSIAIERAYAPTSDDAVRERDTPTSFNAATPPHATRLTRRNPVGSIDKNSPGRKRAFRDGIRDDIARRRSRIRNHQIQINN